MNTNYQTQQVTELFITLVNFEMKMSGKSFDDCKSIVKQNLKQMGLI